VSVCVVADPTIGLFLVDEDTMDEFDSAAKKLFGRGFHFYWKLSAGGLREFEKSAHLTEGTCYYLIDNTHLGEVKPPSNLHNDKAVVELRIAAR